jgi:hypothetical protein
MTEGVSPLSQERQPNAPSIFPPHHPTSAIPKRFPSHSTPRGVPRHPPRSTPKVVLESPFPEGRGWGRARSCPFSIPPTPQQEQGAGRSRDARHPPRAPQPAQFTRKSTPPQVDFEESHPQNQVKFQPSQPLEIKRLPQASQKFTSPSPAFICDAPFCCFVRPMKQNPHAAFRLAATGRTNPKRSEGRGRFPDQCMR